MNDDQALAIRALRYLGNSVDFLDPTTGEHECTADLDALLDKEPT